MSGDETFAELPEETMLLVNRLCNQLEQAWQAGDRPQAETLVAELDPRRRRAALSELIPLEIEYRRLAGESVAARDYLDRFPEFDTTWLIELCAPPNEAAPTKLLLAAETPAAFPSAAAQTIKSADAGRRLGDYELIATLGAGGMGTVYKALHRRMGRVVALKVLRADLQHNPQLLARFEREVRAVARLSHPNIVTAHDAREDDGVHYLITEFVDGADLDRLVKQQGPLSAAQAVDYVTQAARGLAYAHAQQVIHRDIKPANLLLDSTGVVKILDMGLARLAADEALDTNLTASGVIMGTAAYMAPEQARSTRSADHRADIYALGCTLYFLLTGQPPFTGETALEIILAHSSNPIPVLARDGRSDPISPQLRKLFERMVAKQPTKRYQKMADVVRELEQIAGEEALHVPGAVPGNRVARAQRVKLTAAGLGSLLVLAGLWIFFNTDNPPVVTPPELLAGPTDLATDLPPWNEAGVAVAGEVALAFNGRDSYVEVPSLAIEPGEAVTIEALVQPHVHNAPANVVSWLGPDWLALFHTNTGHWGVSRRVASDSLLWTAREPMALNQWSHLAMTADGEALTLFVNGEPASVEPLNFPLPATEGGLYIGGVQADLLPADQNQRFFAGLIAAVRISRGLRYEAAFTAPGELTSDARTLALYQFDAGIGETVADASGHEHPATIVNATWARRR